VGKRVLFVASIGTTLRLFVAPLAQSLRDAGIETIAAAGALDADLDGFDRTHRLPAFRRGGLTVVVQAYRRLRKIAILEKPSLLHLHTPPALVLGRLVARSVGIPSIAVAHGTFLEPKGARSLVYAILETALGRASAATVTENDEDADFYRRFARPGTVFVAPVGGIGIDLARIESARRSPAIRASSPSIVVVGRLTPEKNLDVIVQAFQKVRESRPGATLTFVGSALPGEAPWEVPDRAGLHKAGWTDDPYPIVAAADLLVQASRREGFSMAAAEALLLGVRVVAVTNRGVRQIERHNVDGLAVVANDWRQLADAMERSLALGGSTMPDPALAESWSVEQAVRFQTAVILKVLEATPVTR
jgi:glycosyltransferase involved in cell wall biosynthesis